MERSEASRKLEARGAGSALVHQNSSAGVEGVVSIGLMPDELDRLIERLASNDRSVAFCLEALVLCIRPDGTAFFTEVASRYRDVHLQHARRGEPLGDGSSGQLTLDEARTELASSILPRLARADVIALPPDGLTSVEALITVTDRRLRLSLREPGRMLLARALHRRNAQAVSVADSRVQRPAIAEGEVDAWAQIWFSVQRHVWSTLTIVPAAPGESGFTAASAIVAAGRLYHNGFVDLIDATGAEPAAVGEILAGAGDAVARGAQVIIALDSPLTNPAAIPIARSADAALLTVRLGGSKIASARQTIESIGRECFIGTVALR